MINVPLRFDDREGSGDSGDLWMVRYNFEPEGMDKTGANLSLNKVTRQVSAEFPHFEKENKSYKFQGNFTESAPSEHVLFYDPINRIATIRKIDYSISLRNVRNGQSMKSGVLESPKKTNQLINYRADDNDIRTSIKKSLTNNDLNKLAEEILEDMDVLN